MSEHISHFSRRAFFNVRFSDVKKKISFHREALPRLMKVAEQKVDKEVEKNSD